MPEDTRCLIKTVEETEDGFAVAWQDGHTSRFNGFWLRHQCDCELCGSTVNAVRAIRIHHIPEDIKGTVTSFGPSNLEIKWRNDQHCSVYSGQWLRDQCLSRQERIRRKHRPVLWAANFFSSVPEINFNAAISDPEKRLKMLEDINDFGMCKIVNAPTTAKRASELIELVGNQRQTHYGTYQLSNKKMVDNVGDITAPLDPHTDETYRLSSIGITVFQVLHPSAVGGESTLVDGFEAVRRLKDKWPDDFELLSRVPILTHRIDPAHNSGGQSKWYSACLPFIRLDGDGEVSGIRMNERQIVNFDTEPEEVGACYSALRKLFALLYSEDLRLTFPLKAGEGLIFNNQRVLHGRNGFEKETPPRSVLTSSVDLEEFYSSLRMLRVQLRNDQYPKRYSQGLLI